MCKSFNITIAVQNFRSPGTGVGQILRRLSSCSERMIEVCLVIVNAVSSCIKNSSVVRSNRGSFAFGGNSLSPKQTDMLPGSSDS